LPTSAAKTGKVALATILAASWVKSATEHRKLCQSVLFGEREQTPRVLEGCPQAVMAFSLVPLPGAQEIPVFLDFSSDIL
jgi:hypothetical protein